VSQVHLCYGADAVVRYPIPSLGPARQGGPDARTVFALEQGTPSSAIYVSKTGGVHEGRTRRHDPPDPPNGREPSEVLAPHRCPIADFPPLRVPHVLEAPDLTQATRLVTEAPRRPKGSLIWNKVAVAEST